MLGNDSTVNGSGMKVGRLVSIWVLWWLLALVAQAQENQLKDIQFSTLPGDRLQIRFVFTGAAVEPKVFHTDNPARIVLDLPASVTVWPGNR